MKLENIIYCGDNLTWLKKFPDKCIDLIYLDPPFFSNRHYEVIFNDGEEIRSFEDRWKGGINHYIEWMRYRIFELHRILKDTGSFYLHCDWHANAHLRIILDNIFGTNNLQNEIIWCYKTGGASKERFGRKHETIFFYTKSNKYNFNPQKEKSYMMHKYGFKKSNFQEDERGQYSFVIAKDWWEFPAIGSATKERLGYPTQKPEILLERIIKASSNKDDLVLDPFCGCGTTIAVAQKLGRKWIGIDVSPSACKLMKNRVEKVGARGIEIIGLPVSIDQLKKLPHFEFQNWCVGALGGTVNPKKVGDMGIDGFTFMNRYPIQVKQSEHVGRNVVDNFETAIKRVKKDKGYIIAFSFTKGAYDEVARIRKDGLYIELLTVNDLLGFSEEKVSDKMFEFY